MRFAPVGVVLLLLVAGCSGASDSPPDTAQPTTESTPVPTATLTATQTPTSLDKDSSTRGSPTPTPTSTPSPTPTPTPEPPNNLWKADPVIVAVENEAGYAHQKYDLFREALTYWEKNAPEYADQDVDFELKPDAESPHITIRYVETIEECGENEAPGTTIGCAPIYRYGVAEDHTEVLIRETDDDEILVDTVKHEFGHVLGIDHDEEPMPLMAQGKLHLTASPWAYPSVKLAVDYSDKPGVSESRIEEEMEPGLEYVGGGADGAISPPPGIERVSSRSDANVVIEFHADPRKSDNFQGSSISSIRDGTIEGTQYTRIVIQIYDLDLSALSWHIALQLTRGIQYSNQGSVSLPDALDPENCDAHCRRDSWWR